MRPKPSERQRQLWKMFPLARVGIVYSKREQESVRTLLDAGDVAGAQRLILAHLQLEIDGPPFRVRMHGGRKWLVRRGDR